MFLMWRFLYAVTCCRHYSQSSRGESAAQVSRGDVGIKSHTFILISHLNVIHLE